MVDLVEHGFTAADVVGDVFNMGGTGCPCRQIETRDIQTDPVSLLKEVRRGPERFALPVPWLALLLRQWPEVGGG